jgi:hypothetical protein
MSNCLNFKGKRILSSQTAQNNNLDLDLNVMKKTDTLHDMWKAERGNMDIQGSVTEVFDETGLPPATYLALNTAENKSQSRNQALDNSPYYFGNDENAVNLNSPGSSSRGENLSNLENTMAQYMESTMKTENNNDIPSLCNSIAASNGSCKFKIETLMDDYQSGNNIGPFAQGLIQNPLVNAIQIEIPNNKQKKRAIFREPSNQKKISYVANVILQFCYPYRSDGEVITFPVDASSGPLPCIFQDIDNGVATLATALTIADSATGGVDEKKSKKNEDSLSCNKQGFEITFNKPYQPLLFPFSDQATRSFNIESSYFTKDKLNMYYTENGLPFSSVNKSSMKLVVEVIGGSVYEAPFNLSNSGKGVSGVGVPTLKYIIDLIDKEAGIGEGDRNQDLITDEKIFNKPPQLNITPILNGLWRDNIEKNVIIGFLFDYKRAGDYEQVNSTKIIERDFSQKSILCTGDELCGLYSRYKEQPCIFSHGEFIDIYRFAELQEPPTVEQQQEMIRIREIANLKVRGNIIIQKINDCLKIVQPGSQGQAFIDAYYNQILQWLREVNIDVDGIDCSFVVNIPLCFLRNVLSENLINDLEGLRDQIIGLLPESDKGKILGDPSLSQYVNERVLNFTNKILEAFDNNSFTFQYSDGTSQTVDMGVFIQNLESIFTDDLSIYINNISNITDVDKTLSRNIIGPQSKSGIIKQQTKAPIFNIDLISAIDIIAEVKQIANYQNTRNERQKQKKRGLTETMIINFIENMDIYNNKYEVNVDYPENFLQIDESGNIDSSFPDYINDLNSYCESSETYAMDSDVDDDSSVGSDLSSVGVNEENRFQNLGYNSESASDSEGYDSMDEEGKYMKGGGKLDEEFYREIGDILFTIGDSTLDMIESIYSQIYNGVFLQFEVEQLKEMQERGITNQNLFQAQINTINTLLDKSREFTTEQKTEISSMLTTDNIDNLLGGISNDPISINDFKDRIVSNNIFKEAFREKYEIIQDIFNSRLIYLIDNFTGEETAKNLPIKSAPNQSKKPKPKVIKSSSSRSIKSNFSQIRNNNAPTRTPKQSELMKINTQSDIVSKLPFPVKLIYYILNLSFLPVNPNDPNSRAPTFDPSQDIIPSLNNINNILPRDQPLYQDVFANILTTDENYRIPVLIFIAFVGQSFLKRDDLNKKYFRLDNKISELLESTYTFSNERQLDDNLRQLISAFFPPPNAGGSGKKTRKNKQVKKAKKHSIKKGPKSKKHNSKKHKKRNRKKSTTIGKK